MVKAFEKNKIDINGIESLKTGNNVGIELIKKYNNSISKLRDAAIKIEDDLKIYFAVKDIDKELASIKENLPKFDEQKLLEKLNDSIKSGPLSYEFVHPAQNKKGVSLTKDDIYDATIISAIIKAANKYSYYSGKKNYDFESMQTLGKIAQVINTGYQELISFHNNIENFLNIYNEFLSIDDRKILLEKKEQQAIFEAEQKPINEKIGSYISSFFESINFWSNKQQPSSEESQGNDNKLIPEESFDELETPFVQLDSPEVINKIHDDFQAFGDKKIAELKSKCFDGVIKAQKEEARCKINEVRFDHNSQDCDSYALSVKISFENCQKVYPMHTTSDSDIENQLKFAAAIEAQIGENGINIFSKDTASEVYVNSGYNALIDAYNGNSATLAIAAPISNTGENNNIAVIGE
jgi:hypothetical protein